MKKLLLTAMLSLGLAFAATADNTSFSYQGVLRDAQGNTITEKNQEITFRLYDSATEGDPLWGCVVSVLLDDNGLFTAELSDGAGSRVPGLDAELKDVIADNASKTLFIGLTVGDSSEIRPRQKLIAVPKAAFAEDVATARKDFTVEGTATLRGAVNASSNVSVDGRVTTRDLTVNSSATLVGDVAVRGSLTLSGSSVGLALDGDTPFTVGGVNALIPAGIIVMWSGAANAIPDGWALCDGTHGPDLRDRFIVGAGRNYSVNDVGGEATHTLTSLEMPKHTHSYTFYTADLGASWDDDAYFFDYSEHYKRDSNKKSKTTESAGGGQPHNNLPPYYALCFIIKL